MRNDGMSSAAAIKKVRETTSLPVTTGNMPSKAAVLRHLKSGATPGEAPRRRGHLPMIPRDVQSTIANKVRYFMSIGYGMDEQAIIADMMRSVAGTDADAWYNDKAKGGSRQRRWFYLFKNDEEWGLSKGAVLPAEVARGDWTTAKNVGHHYDMLKEWFPRARVAAWFDADGNELEGEQPGAEFKITKPRRVLSFDESAVKLSQTEEHSEAVGPKGMKKTQIASKAVGRATGIACNAANGDHLTPLFIWAIGKSNRLVDLMKGGPKGHVTDADGNSSHPQPYHFANEKGSITNCLVIPYFEKCILPHYTNLSEVRVCVCGEKE